MPIPWICDVCRKWAYNQHQMCEHLREKHGGGAFFEKRPPKRTVNAIDENNNDWLVNEHIVHSDQ